MSKYSNPNYFKKKLDSNQKRNNDYKRGTNSLYFIPTETCFEKKTCCVNRKHNST